MNCIAPYSSASRRRLSSPYAVTIMTGKSGWRFFTSRNRVSPSMPGMLMSDKITISLRLDLGCEQVQRLFPRIGEVHDIGSGAALAAKLLPEQRGDIGLVIHNQDADAHRIPETAGKRLLARQANGELGERTGLTLNRDCTAMLLRDDIVTYR